MTKFHEQTDHCCFVTLASASASLSASVSGWDVLVTHGKVDFSNTVTCLKDAHDFLLRSVYLNTYCKTHNVRGVKFSLFNENDILAHFNFAFMI